VLARGLCQLLSSPSPVIKRLDGSLAQISEGAITERPGVDLLLPPSLDGGGGGGGGGGLGGLINLPVSNGSWAIAAAACLSLVILSLVVLKYLHPRNNGAKPASAASDAAWTGNSGIARKPRRGTSSLASEDGNKIDASAGAASPASTPADHRTTLVEIPIDHKQQAPIEEDQSTLEGNQA